MTGTDRLRTLAGAWDEWGLGGALTEIADEIERELREERDRWDSELCEAQMDKSRVTAVCLEMNKHCLGHEGMEDSPVARWARELREALKSDTSDAADTQNPSCTGTAETAGVTSEDAKVTREDREAIAWVREHGGIESVKAQRRESMPRAAYERKKAGFLDHIAECETALGRRREIISKLGHRVSDLTRENVELRKRAMPEGCQWPRYESGELVGFGDEVNRLGEVFSISLYCDGSFALNFRAYSKGERVKRHAPAVLAADGEPLEVGQTVWHVATGREYTVRSCTNGGAHLSGDGKPAGYCRADYLTHQRPVLDADGMPINKGDTVWNVNDGTEYEVGGIRDTEDVDGDLCKIIECSNDELHIYYVCLPPDKLTHTKPEIDSWERLEEDLSKSYTEYWGCVDVICNRCPAEIDGKKPHERFDACPHNCILAMRHDIVRRCKALAEREKGE